MTRRWFTMHHGEITEVATGEEYVEASRRGDCTGLTTTDGTAPTWDDFTAHQCAALQGYGDEPEAPEPNKSQPKKREPTMPSLFDLDEVAV